MSEVAELRKLLEEQGKLIQQQQKQLESQGQAMNQLHKEMDVTRRNLTFMRELAEEVAHLGDQTSGIMVEHVGSLDKRLNEIGQIFVGKMERLAAQGETDANLDS